MFETILMTWGALTLQQGCPQGLQNELIPDLHHADNVGVLARHLDLEVHITEILGKKKCSENTRLT